MTKDNPASKPAPVTGAMVESSLAKTLDRQSEPKRDEKLDRAYDLVEIAATIGMGALEATTN